MNPIPPLPLIDGSLFIDNSGWMEGLTTCPRALEYKQLHRRIPVAESTALNFGSAIHLALEFRYRNYQNEPVDVFFQDRIAPILTSFFEQHPTPLDDWRNLNWAFEVMNQYNRHYEREDFSLLKYGEPRTCPQCEGKGCEWCNQTGKNEYMVELSFALPLCKVSGIPFYVSTTELKVIDIPVYYTGKIDLPVVIDNQIFIQDHKTASMLGPSFFQRMKMSAQQKGYCWAFEQLTGQKVAGYVVNAIRVKEPPQYVTNNQVSARTGKKQSPDEWWKESLQREKYYIKPGELDEWKQNTISILEEFFWNYSRGYMPMKTQWCTVFGQCPYFDVCTMEKQDRAVLLSSGLFADNNWSPLKNPTQSKQ